jgi:hypothetical protein
MVTVNLVALRKLDGENAQNLRRYVLGIALVAATEPLDGFLRQGCLLVQDEKAVTEWVAVARDGGRTPISSHPILRSIMPRPRPLRATSASTRIAFKENWRRPIWKELDKKKGKKTKDATDLTRLLISVRFDGRYRSGECPPSPAGRLEALIAGAARVENLPERAAEAFEWLEGLSAPTIAAPSAYDGRSFKTFVPNNDLDAVGGDSARIGEIRTAKIIRPRYFDAPIPLLYAWTFEQSADAEGPARMMCEIADNLYQLGRGVDVAWAQGEVINEVEAEARLCGHGGVVRRPCEGGTGAPLSCPQPGSLASLMKRFTATRKRFTTVGKGKKTQQLFSQAPKPDFAQVPYDSPPTFLLFRYQER